MKYTVIVSSNIVISQEPYYEVMSSETSHPKSRTCLIFTVSFFWDVPSISCAINFFTGFVAKLPIARAS